MKLGNLFNKKNWSNIVFVLVVAMMLYPPSREWFMRQIAFSPSIEAAEKAEKVDDFNWKLKGLNSKDINFNELEGKVIFVNFWATWCPPCRAEMPMIQELYDDYKDKVAFIFITNENEQVVSKFFKEKNYNLPSYNSLSLPPKNLSKTNSIPASYLLDKNGNILVSKVGAADWNSKKVRTLLDKLLVE